MVNVSLEVGLNNTVSPQQKQAEDSAEGKGFMAMLAEASEQEEARASAQNHADREEQAKQETNRDNAQASKVGNDQAQAGQVDHRAVPESLAEPLKLDESNLPQPKQGPDVALKVATSEEVNKAATTSSADTLLSQINASNNQKTGVEHHLAPVPQALKAHLGNAEKVDEVPVKGSNKGPIDLIGPIVVQGQKPATEEGKVESKLMVSEAGGSKKPVQSHIEAVKPSPTGPRQSEGPVGDPTDGIVKGNTTSNLLEKGGKEHALPESFGGVKKEREWHLHDNKSMKPNATTEAMVNAQVNIEGAGEAPQGVEKAPTEAERKTPNLISDLMQKANASAQGQDKSTVKETDKMVPVSKGGTETVEKSAHVSKHNTIQVEEASQSAAKQPGAEASAVLKSGEAIKKEQLAELKVMVDNLSPDEKQALEKLVNERLNDAKSTDTVSKKQEAALYHALTGKSLTQTAESNTTTTAKTTMGSDSKDKVTLLGEKLSSDKPEGIAKANTTPTPEFTYNSTKVAVKEQPAVDASKLSATEVVVGSEEQAELPSEFEGEQQSSNHNQRQTASQNVENVFKAIRTLGNEQIQSKEEFDQVVQQVEQSRQNQQASVQQSNTQAKLQMDPGVAQALNLTRSDAAKMLQDKVNMMINLNNQEAEIRLDPAELGSMHIRIRSDAEQAQINFVVQNQEAKELLEESMPKLKEMLEEQGIALGESNIQQDSEGNSNSDENESQGHGKLANEASEAQNNNEQSVTSKKQSDSAIDYYA
ncbi:flagellar hook-length control protein FliK [Pseudoalteromonas sp. SMS1]|uniref:flagellar hook-length control protein FliK n=1 Tax=Pseudoalteromonas sp. SMS1 TaxID=2908894 RepID=UPI001F25E34A|nr:flagellar hook-length control protein FliK [Pseudoalteromonas sp. SMS1]MCF2859388.1 flagellar hook-length control protein FliK [Pseudoalteromonas sp. SMS1]